MILWTIQDEAVWSALEREGVYAVSDKAVYEEWAIEGNPQFDKAFVRPYDWMIDQMDRRVGPAPEGVHYPIWAMYKEQGRLDGKPDMRERLHAKPGRHVVRLRLDVPDERVLLSDFDDWHAVLNYWFLSRTELESKAFDIWVEALGVDHQDISDFERHSPELGMVRECVEKSWGRMFNVADPREKEWDCPWKMRTIQATLWQLFASDVRSVEHFVAR